MLAFSVKNLKIADLKMRIFGRKNNGQTSSQMLRTKENVSALRKQKKLLTKVAEIVGKLDGRTLN